jgi:hypothetical protein
MCQVTSHDSECLIFLCLIRNIFRSDKCSNDYCPCSITRLFQDSYEILEHNYEPARCHCVGDYRLSNARHGSLKTSMFLTVTYLEILTR